MSKVNGLRLGLVTEVENPEFLAALDAANILPSLSAQHLQPAHGLTPEAAQTYAACLAVGMSPSTAATQAGLKGGLVTAIINRWREGRYVQGSAAWVMGRYLSECTYIGVAELEKRCLDGILAAGEGKSQGDWRALAWLLERLNPEKYQLRSKWSQAKEANEVPNDSDLEEIVEGVRANLSSSVRVAVEVTNHG